MANGILSAIGQRASTQGRTVLPACPRFTSSIHPDVGLPRVPVRTKLVERGQPADSLDPRTGKSYSWLKWC